MTKPVVIIGAGPAGLSCARTLVDGGREVVLIDDNHQPGGQYFRQLPPSYQVAGKAPLLRDKDRYDQLARVLDHPSVRHLPLTTAWGAPDNLTVSYGGPGGSGRVDAAAVVIASGAQDNPFPFPGWTIPGVISAGGCLNLVKGHALVPAGKVLIAGNGPLVLVAAATLIRAGADVVGIIEARASRHLVSVALEGMWAAPEVMRTALAYRWRMLRSGARIWTGWTVAEAFGIEAVERVALAPVGPDGRPVLQDQEWWDIDTLVVGYGLLPSCEYARMLGCKSKFEPELNGVVPTRSSSLETSLPGVYAIGDGAGIGGVEVALLEGHIAAQAILGISLVSSLRRRYRRLDRFRRRLNVAFAPDAPLVSAREDTLICRCEEIRLNELMAQAKAANDNLNRLKTSSRLGMGRCQGRNCLPVAGRLLGLKEDGRNSYPRSRPPVRPIQLRYIAADADVGAAHEPDDMNISEG